MKFPRVCISGSMRFHNEMLRLAQKLTRQGCVVLMPFVSVAPDEQASPELKKMLGEMHSQRIDMSDLLYVVNVGGYIGESTHDEISYAQKRGVPIHYTN